MVRFLEQNPDAAAAVALRSQLQDAQKDLAAITSQKAKVCWMPPLPLAPPLSSPSPPPLLPYCMNRQGPKRRREGVYGVGRRKKQVLGAVAKGEFSRSEHVAVGREHVAVKAMVCEGWGCTDAVSRSPRDWSGAETCVFRMRGPVSRAWGGMRVG